MQTALALCHFCENHGPRVVITSQPVRNFVLPTSSSTLNNSEAEGRNCISPNSEERSSNMNDKEEAEQQSSYYGDVYQGVEVVDDEPRCAACSSFNNGMGMISNDHRGEIGYVSTQMPINERLSIMLRQACLRSLSVEISAPLSVETQTTHSQEPTKSAESHSFSTHKSSKTKAGNLQEDGERDGVVLFGDDEHWYTLSYTFRLKDAKARGFHRFYSLIAISLDKLLLLRNYDYLVNAMGEIIGKLQTMTDAFFVLEQQQDNELRLASNVSTKGAQHWLPQQLYPKRCTFDTERSLKVISNSGNIFTKLHRQMLNLLVTLTSLDSDIVLEGCPTQDMLTVMEMSNSSSPEEHELVAQLTPRQSILHLRNLRTIVEHVEPGTGPTIDHLSLVSTIIWQVVIGGQIVVRSLSVEARRLFLLALAQLLPVGCARLDGNAPQYSYSYKHNFLGCTPSMEIPEDVLSEVILVTLIPRGVSENEEDDGDKESLRHFRLTVDSYPQRSEGEWPAIVARYRQLLSDPMINDLTLESALRSTRNDWLNKAKLIFQLRHQRNAIDLNQVLRVIKCREQDSPVILFWQKGLSERYKQVVMSTASNCALKQRSREASDP